MLKVGCECRCFSSLYNSLHLPAFAGFSNDFKTLNRVVSKIVCHSWANSGEIGQKLKFVEGFLLYEGIIRCFHGKIKKIPPKN